MHLSFCDLDADLERGTRRESKVLNQLDRQRRPKIARGQRPWMAAGLSGTCEAKIDDRLPAAPAPAAAPPPPHPPPPALALSQAPACHQLVL